ncbi:integral membrane protein MviN [Desulfurispirillum indicum S5]|uniref:Probable lipid II flippase MurJ n=1 Tax=Desulfurispirillum indicum (strain ATCC BAA-1389 / DSM 22839 / S5) TaxID=653733 RepID=E6W4C8_DESIS|nr:murein biosynthesis integral membrane protein MurJ [Desulfurispirillum indicum]ADU65902.1 integral membrane protein MviN [Desulfurispirillum indicum S5]
MSQQGESRLLARAVASFASATFLSRIVGFVRDMVIAMFFGAGHRADAFFIAFSIPSLLRRLFAEGALSASFVSILSKTVKSDGDEQGNELFQKVLSLLSVVLAGVTLVGVIAAPLLVWVMAPGFGLVEGKHEMTVLLTRIMFPFLFFIGMATTVMAVLNTKGKFFIASFTSFAFNLAIIVAAIIGYYAFDQSIYALGIGVTIGGLLQFLMQIPSLYRLRYRLRFRLDFRDPRIVQIVTLMGPGVIGLAVAQVNTTVDSIIASYLVAGSVSFLYYANRLVQFPLGVFGVAVSTAILPGLSRSVVDRNSGELNGLLRRGIDLINFITLPCIVGLVIAGDDIIRLLFQRGEFTEYDALMTYMALAAYSLGLLAFALVKLVVSLFYSLEDSKTPLKAAAWAMLVNILLNLALMYPLGHAGLALATSAASWGNFLYLWHIARQRGMTDVRLFNGETWRILLVSGMLGAVLLVMKFALLPWLDAGTGLRVVLYLGVAAAVYLPLARVARIDSLNYIQKSLMKKEIAP